MRFGWDTSWNKHRNDSLGGRSLLASGLAIVSLVYFLSPTLTVIFRELIPWLPEKEFVAIAMAGTLFGAYMLLSNNVLPGLVASFLVLITVRINVPLGPSRSFVGAVGPNLWVFYAPLVGLVTYYVLRGERPEVDLPHYLFAGFVGWSLLAALVGNGPRPDIALWFTLFVFLIGLVFWLTTRLVADGVASFTHSVLLLVMAVIGHAVIGLLQFINRRPLGFPHHGEAARSASELLTLGPLGTFPIGPHVNGFAFGGPLTVLITLTVPTTAVFAVRRGGIRRLFWAGTGLSLLFVQRATAWDAGRGGVIVALGTLGVLGLWTYRSRLPKLTNRPRTPVATAIGGCLALMVVLLPGTRSGTASLPDDDAGSDTEPAASSGGGESTPSTETPSGSSGQQTGTSDDTSFAESFSVPFFDTSNLGIRLQMYAEAVGMSLTYPLFGLGGANFPFVAVQTSLDRSYWLHNMYLQVLVGTGVPGFLLYCGSIGLVLLAGVRLLSMPEADTLLVAGVLAGLVGALAQFSLNPLFNRMASIMAFWALLGVLFGEYLRLRDATSPGSPT